MREKLAKSPTRQVFWAWREATKEEVNNLQRGSLGIQTMVGAKLELVGVTEKVEITSKYAWRDDIGK